MTSAWPYFTLGAETSTGNSWNKLPKWTHAIQHSQIRRFCSLCWLWATQGEAQRYRRKHGSFDFGRGQAQISDLASFARKRLIISILQQYKILSFSLPRPQHIAPALPRPHSIQLFEDNIRWGWVSTCRGTGNICWNVRITNLNK